MTGTCSILDAKWIHLFSRVRNGLKMMVSGYKSSSRKSSEVGLRPERAEHLPDGVEGLTRAQE